MKLYRAQPSVVEAAQFTGENCRELAEWVGKAWVIYGRDRFVLETPQGMRYAKRGDWIIRWLDGRFVHLESELFEAVFRPYP